MILAASECIQDVLISVKENKIFQSKVECRE